MGCFLPSEKNVKGHHIFSLMLHNHKRWAFPCPADKVGSESLKPFEGLFRGVAVQLCGKPARGLPAVSLL